MVRYETLFLTVPEITNDEASSIETQFDGLVRKAKGAFISFERWGKYRLAYPVAKNEYGVYFLVRFEVDPAQNIQLLDEIKSFFNLKYSNLVKRNLTSKLDPKASLAYQRPESLEESPHDVDDFLRKNKMEGLITPQKKREASVAEKAPKVAAEPKQEAAAEVQPEAAPEQEKKEAEASTSDASEDKE